MKDKISFQSGLFQITMTTEEVKQMHSDYQFLLDAVLSIAAPKTTKDSDLDFDHEDYVKYTRELYKKTGFSQSFVDQCFKEHKQCSNK